MLHIGLLLLASAAAQDWPMLGRDAARSGSTPTEIRPPFERKWVRAFPDEGINAGVQPVITDGTLYAGTLRGTLYAIDAETGKDRWSFKAGGAILHAAAADGKRVFFGAADGKVYAVNADGSPAWTVQTGAAVWNAPAVHAGVVYIGSRDGTLFAIDAASGAVRWSTATGGPILSSPAVDEKLGRVYVGSEDMQLYAFDLAGKLIWKSPKLPGSTHRGYHPVIAPDGAVMVTSAPVVGSDTIQQLLLDMAKEVFGNFASWRNPKDENERLRRENFALMEKPETYARQLDYLRKRLADQPVFQTFFVLDPETGRHRFVAPVIHAESMNGPTAPPVVAPDGRVIVKYSALLRSRYEHYSPFLNVGVLDSKTGHITPIMDPSRVYGWHDSLLLVHDEQSQLAVAGKVLINTHQDNVNAMDLETLKGYPAPFALNVHEVKPGEPAALWALHLAGKPLPVGWEWFARGTAVYGGGSVLDVPISIAGDSFYYLPTHEINAGCVIIAYRMKADGTASKRAPAPAEKFGEDAWKKADELKWDWDLLGMSRLKPALAGLPSIPPGTRQNPRREEARAEVAQVADTELDEEIWREPTLEPRGPAELRDRLAAAVEELTATRWRPLAFPAGKHPPEGYRIFADPSETLYTLALAVRLLPPEIQGKVKVRVAEMLGPQGDFARKTYDPAAGEVRSAYDPPPDSAMRVAIDVVRTDTARLYPLWLWGHASGEWEAVNTHWPRLKALVRFEPPKEEADFGNGRLAGLIAACRLAKRFGDEEFVARALPLVREALRARLVHERAHTEGGLINEVPALRTHFGRWHHLSPDVARILRRFAGAIHRRLMDVYVDHHRPTWWLAWNVELLWRNECPLSLPSMSADIFAARALILGEPAGQLSKFLDLPWCRGDEYFVQKLALAILAGP